MEADKKCRDSSANTFDVTLRVNNLTDYVSHRVNCTEIGGTGLTSATEFAFLNSVDIPFTITVDGTASKFRCDTETPDGRTGGNFITVTEPEECDSDVETPVKPTVLNCTQSIVAGKYVTSCKVKPDASTDKSKITEYECTFMDMCKADTIGVKEELRDADGSER